jgi:hypothetical protein
MIVDVTGATNAIYVNNAGIGATSITTTGLVEAPSGTGMNISNGPT